MKIQTNRMVLVCFGLATAIVLVGGAVGCAKDEKPPVIKEYEIPEWVVEDESVELRVDTFDDRETQQVYVQLDSGLIIPLSKKSTRKGEGEEAEWEANTKLPIGNYSYYIVAKDSRNETDSKTLLELTVYPYDASGDGIGYRDKIKYGLDPNKKHPVAKYLLDRNLSIYIPQLEILDNDQTLDENEKAFIDLLPTMDKNFVDWVVKNKFTFEDGEVNDMELKLLKNSTNQACIQQLLDQYISEIGKLNPELAMELEKLPDFKQTDIRGVEAAEDVLALCVEPQSEYYRKFLEDCLNEGVKDKRKYCAPLQALVWYFYDKEKQDMDRKPWEETQVGSSQVWKAVHFGQSDYGSFVYYSWNVSSESKGYNTERWKDFNEVVERLSSPILIAFYMRDNFTYDWDAYKKVVAGSGYFVRSPQKIFHDKKGICSEASGFALYCLLNNGYKYDNFDSNKDKAACRLDFDIDKQIAPVGHQVCVVRENYGFLVISFSGTTSISYAGTSSDFDYMYLCPLGCRFVDVDGRVTKLIK